MWLSFAVTPPAQRVQFILGEDQADSGHEPHPLFSEMEELCLDEDGEMEWKETARWVKFEEDVEVNDGAELGYCEQGGLEIQT